MRPAILALASIALISAAAPRGAQSARAAVSGVVTDANGGPAAGVSVAAMSPSMKSATTTQQPTPRRRWSRTDEHGAYRLDDLAAGEYLVGVPNQVYYPAARKLAAAGVLKIAAGESRTLNFTLPRMTFTRVSGVVTYPSAVALSSTSVRLVNVDDPPLFFAAGFMTAGADGAFSFDNVRPGAYRAFAQAAEAGGPASGAQGPQRFWAQTELVVGDRPVQDVRLTLEPGATISGRIVSQGSRPPDLSLTTSCQGGPGTLEYEASPAAWGSGGSVVNLFAARPGADGRFSIVGIPPGRCTLTSYLGTPIGTVTSVTWKGRETIDDPLPLGSGDVASDVIVTVTDRVTTIDGTLVDASGGRALDSVVVAFAVDRQFWSARSHRIRASWPDPKNHFEISGLPPGQYYLVVLTHPEPDSWFDPEVLATLAPRSMEVTLGAGERKTMALRAGR